LNSQTPDSNSQKKYVIKLLDKYINNGDDNFAPVYFKDYNLFIFTSDRNDDYGHFKRQNLLYSKILDTNFAEAFFFRFPIE
jgi:hypothetical protein